MGFYIEFPQRRQKVSQLRAQFPAVRVLSKPEFLTSFSSVTVCVMDNGPFEAASVVYSPAEFEALTHPDDARPKVWLTLPRANLDQLIGEGRVPAGVLRVLP